MNINGSTNTGFPNNPLYGTAEAGGPAQHSLRSKVDQPNDRAVFPAAGGPAAAAAQEERSTSALPSLSALGRKAWTLPNTLLGLLWGLIAVPFGARISTGNNALQFEQHPWMSSRGALTLGNTISYGSLAAPDRPLGGSATVGDHERQHTYQAELLGPFYLPAHALEGGKALLLEGRWHSPANALERGPQRPVPAPW